MQDDKNMNSAMFAAGCFWGVEEKFRNISGVRDVVVGYAGGKTKNPTYEEVCTGDTRHAEAVRVFYDSDVITYEMLVRKFFALHDPTTKNQQGPDKGTQYRSAIFYANDDERDIAERVMCEIEEHGSLPRSIATEIVPAGEFYKAEEYHQQYIKKHGGGVCNS